MARPAGLISNTRPDPRAPGIFALADPDRIIGLVTEAGFAPPEIGAMALRWPFPGPDAYWRFLTEMAGPISSVLRGLSSEARDAVRTRVHEAARPFYHGEGYEFPTLCLNAATRL